MLLWESIARGMASTKVLVCMYVAWLDVCIICVVPSLSRSLFRTSQQKNQSPPWSCTFVSEVDEKLAHKSAILDPNLVCARRAPRGSPLFVSDADTTFHTPDENCIWGVCVVAASPG